MAEKKAKQTEASLGIDSPIDHPMSFIQAYQQQVSSETFI